MNLNPTTYAEALAMLENYPYFPYAALKALEFAPDAEAKTRMKAILATSVCEESELREILGLNSESLTDFYPDDIPPQLSTEDTIETFLDKFGSGISGESSTLIPIPQVSGDAYIPGEGEDENPSDSELNEDSTLSTIDAFLKIVPAPQPRAERAPKEALTESFAKILIKNHNYSKALEIIQELNLKNPEKSIYFADQIRFLKKLIINESKK